MPFLVLAEFDECVVRGVLSTKITDPLQRSTQFFEFRSSLGIKSPEFVCEALEVLVFSGLAG